MRTILIAGFLGAGLFLTGCETTVVDRHHGHGEYGVYSSSSYGHEDGRYRDGDYGHNRTRNVERTNIHENNVYQTNVHRTNVSTQSQRRQSTVSGPSRMHQQAGQKAQSKAADQKGHRKDKKHENGQAQ